MERDEKQRQEHFLDRGAFYKYLVDHLQECLVVIDKEYQIVEMNEVFRKRHVGVSEGEKCYEVTHGYNAPCSVRGVRCPVEEVITSGEAREAIHEHRSGGRRVWESVYAFPVRWKGGEVEYIGESLRDLTPMYERQNWLEEALSGLIRVLGRVVEARDPYTAGHQRRVGQLAVGILREMGEGKSQEWVVRLAGEVHDVGKIAIPVEILCKPGGLVEEEYRLVQRHPEVGAEILEEIVLGEPIGDVIRQHHENVDGSGYPRGLKGEEILLEARILRVADTVEAMSFRRPYREAIGVEKAMKEIEDGKGRYYDKEVVEACKRVFKQGFRFETEEGRRS